MLWQLRYTFVAIAVVVVALVPVPDTAQSEYAAAVLSRYSASAPRCSSVSATPPPITGGGSPPLWAASSSARTPEQRADVGGHRRAAVAVRSSTGCARRQVGTAGWPRSYRIRRRWPGVRTDSEGPADADARADLLDRRAADIQTLAAGGYIDAQARVLLMTANTAAATAQSGLEHPNEPVPIHYDLFIQGLAWFFGIMAFSGSTAPLTKPAVSLWASC